MYGPQPARRTSTTTSPAGPRSHYAPSEFQEAEESGGTEPPDPWTAAGGSDPEGRQPTSWWAPSTWDDGWWTSSWSRYWEEDVVPQGSCPELLLEMIQGWYLLCDGLDTGERNMKIFVAETKGADIIVAGGSMMPAMKIVYGCLATHLFSPHIDQIPRRHRLI